MSKELVQDSKIYFRITFPATNQVFSLVTDLHVIILFRSALESVTCRQINNSEILGSV
jgi:hypothetical protein